MSATPARRIGMFGIGLMGHGIASNLVRHGHALRVLDHPGNQPLDALRAQGVTSAAKPAEVARGSEVLIVCVTGSPQVEAVLLGTPGAPGALSASAPGALSAIAPGTVVIDCSTSLPDSTVRIAQAVAAAGGRFLDAPMTRTPKEAAEGRLNLLVGGERALFDECLPLLRCFAENITHTGPVGSGHRMKLLHNYVSLGFVALLSEAAACAQRAGMAPEVLVEVLAKGGGGGVALERIKPCLLAGDVSALRFAMGNARKDLDYYTTMAGQGQAVHAIADAVLATFERGVAQAGADTGVLELVRVLRG